MTPSVPVKLTYAYGTTPLERGREAKIRRRESATYTGFTSTASGLISITVHVTPLGGATANTFGTCAPSAAGTSGTCTVTITTVPGPTTISGTLTELGSTIATFSKLIVVQPSTINAIAFTASPVVTHATVQLGATNINAGTPNSVVVWVDALDANGNIIAGTTPYVDVNGNPVTLTLSVQNSQSGGKGTVTFKGPMLISAPNQAPTYLQYDGRWMDTATVSVASSSSAVTPLTGNTLTITPYAQEYSTPSGAMFLTSGPDGNLWVTEWSGSGIAKLTTDGVYTPYACGTCNGTHGITVGPDNNIWYVEANWWEIDKITLTGVPTRIAGLVGGIRIVLGPDGNLWATSSNTVIAKVTTTGVVTNYTVGNNTRGITVGPDGNIWFTDPGIHIVGVFSPTGSLIASYSIPALSGVPDGIITGPDGNVWVGNQGSNLIYRITPSGAITPFTLQAGASPRDLVVGPDGYIWFAEQGKDGIGRISTSGAVTEYGAASGFSAGSSPTGITVGPDGNLWIAENGSQHVAKFVY